MKMRNNGLKCKEMKNYCTVLMKLAEKFSLAASQPKALASLSAFLSPFDSSRILLPFAEKAYGFYKLTIKNTSEFFINQILNPKNNNTSALENLMLSQAMV